MSFQAMCAQVWLDVSADSRIEGEVDDVRRDVRFTVNCERDEFELSFEPEALRRFVALAESLLPKRGQGTVTEVP